MHGKRGLCLAFSYCSDNEIYTKRETLAREIISAAEGFQQTFRVQPLLGFGDRKLSTDYQVTKKPK